jgi:competence protein ComFB
MDIHNTTEDIVFSSVEAIFGEIQKQGNPEKFCFCDQCRMDTICYALNRIEPHYIVSNRGLTRIEHDDMRRQQVEADIASLVYKGLRLVKHNQRPTTSHESSTVRDTEVSQPAFEIPTIVGRLFDGITFAPLSGITITLYRGGEAVPMRNHNWQNPYTLVENTPGTFTFWPAPIPADSIDIEKIFEFSLKIEGSGYDPLNHFFKIIATSQLLSPYSYSLDRTFKLPDLYMFAPGEAEQNG